MNSRKLLSLLTVSFVLVLTLAISVYANAVVAFIQPISIYYYLLFVFVPLVFTSFVGTKITQAKGIPQGLVIAFVSGITPSIVFIIMFAVNIINIPLSSDISHVSLLTDPISLNLYQHILSTMVKVTIPLVLGALTAQRHTLRYVTQKARA